jgi:hypothetical protein
VSFFSPGNQVVRSGVGWLSFLGLLPIFLAWPQFEGEIDFFSRGREGRNRQPSPLDS